MLRAPPTIPVNIRIVVITDGMWSRGDAMPKASRLSGEAKRMINPNVWCCWGFLYKNAADTVINAPLAIMRLLEKLLSHIKPSQSIKTPAIKDRATANLSLCETGSVATF